MAVAHGAQIEFDVDPGGGAGAEVHPATRARVARSPYPASDLQPSPFALL
ncbi:hypothetical protein [Streptomyces sp. cg36]